MDELLKVLKALLPGNSDKTYKGIVAMLGLEGKTVDTDGAGGDDTVTIKSIAVSLQDLGYKVELPGLKVEGNPKTRKSAMPFGYEKDPATPADEDDEETDEEKEKDKNKKAMKAASILRFGEKDAATKAIMADILGESYEQRLYDQEIAFAKYIRHGLDGVDSVEERRLLRVQIFPVKTLIKAITEGGFDVRTMKATQVEAQGDLGGIAVPPQRQSEIEQRLQGLATVRAAGATVIQLINSNAVEIPYWKHDDTNDPKQRKIGMLSGTWNNETGSLTVGNFKLELLPVIANLYNTPKIPLSVSLVDDAPNLISILMNDLVTTRAMDEDTAFVSGDGVGKPEGILPGGTNAHSLAVVNSQSATAFTSNGVKALKRGIAGQYRTGASFHGNSTSWGEVEVLTVGGGNLAYAFPDLAEEDRLLNHQVYENEAFPDPADNGYPLLYGQMSGYVIVERLGMTIERFHDSGTGANKVEYQGRSRVGGKISKPYMFAVQKIAA